MAKVTISFVTDQQSEDIRIESDHERNRDSAGSVKKRFLYGDTAYLRVYSAAPHLLSVCSTDGETADLGIFTEEVTGEVLSFFTEETAETEKPVNSITGCRWLGSSLGSISISGAYSVKSELKPSPEENLIASASINYRSTYRLFGLTLSQKDMEEYPVAVYVRCTNA